jgi:hypothetical protein
MPPLQLAIMSTFFFIKSHFYQHAVQEFCFINHYLNLNLKLELLVLTGNPSRVDEMAHLNKTALDK